MKPDNTFKIFTIADKAEEKFLRAKTADFDFSRFSRQDIKDLVEKLKKAMAENHGIGLAANQIGLNIKVFIAVIPSMRNREKKSTEAAIGQPQIPNGKFYAIFNPEIAAYSRETEIAEEGCLSVPGIYGEVERASEIALVGFNKDGRRVRIKAQGLVARVFQHEIDHLNGILFIDKAKELHKVADN